MTAGLLENLRETLRRWLAVERGETAMRAMPQDNSDLTEAGGNGQGPQELETIALDGAQGDSRRWDHTADSPLGYIQVEIDSNGSSAGSPDSDRLDNDFVTIGTDAERVIEEINDYTQDAGTIEDFAERQEMGAGSDELLQRLQQRTGQSPVTSGSDLDADWERTDQSGEEAVGGSVPTPDQDVVEELGAAVGVTYRDDEPLNTEDKLNARDEARWELNPASADDELEQLDELYDRVDRLEGLGVLDDEVAELADENELLDLLDEAGLPGGDRENLNTDEFVDPDDDFLLGGLDEDEAA